MDETDANLRASTLDTLQFLASPTEQRRFAAKVFYENYAGEFACWFFDSFLPENPFTHARYTAQELSTLNDFSQRFDQLLQSLADRPLTINALLNDPQWREVVSAAQAACKPLGLAYEAA